MAGLLSNILNAGPGWLADIFTLQLVFDADFEDAESPPYIEKLPEEDGSQTDMLCSRAIFSSMAKVQGTLRVSAPPGRTVAHGGISMRLESTFVVEEDSECRDLYLEELNLVPAGHICGAVDIPFVFEGCARAALFESHEGDLFSIRHNVIGTVTRPWYTFEVSETVPITIQRVFDIARPASVEKSSTLSKGKRNPAGSVSVAMDEEEQTASGVQAADFDIGADKIKEETGQLSDSMSEQLALYGPQAFAVGGLPDGGKSSVTLEKGCFELTEHLVGSLDFWNVTKPVVYVTLSVVKVERYRLEEPVETLVFEDALLDARLWKEAKRSKKLKDRLRVERAAAEEELPSEDAEDHVLEEVEEDGGWMPDESDYAEAGEEGQPDPNLPVLGDVSLSMDLDFSQLDISPTLVVDLVAIEAEPDTVTSKPKLHDRAKDYLMYASRKLSQGEEASVRYFVRLDLYTDFTVESRVSASHEIVLYRGQVYGRPVPPTRALPPLPEHDQSSQKSVSPPSGKPPVAPISGRMSSVKPVEIIPLARKSSVGSTTSSQPSPRTPHLPAGAASPNPLAMGRPGSFHEEEEEMIDAETGIASIELSHVGTQRATSASSVN